VLENVGSIVVFGVASYPLNYEVLEVRLAAEPSKKAGQF
jgi:hypothetical protein